MWLEYLLVTNWDETMEQWMEQNLVGLLVSLYQVLDFRWVEMKADLMDGK